MNGQLHTPVMVSEMLEGLAPRDGGAYVDGTFGDGGYSRAILDSADCSVWAVDRDAAAITRGRAMETDYASRFTILHGRFGDMVELLRAAGVDRIDGIALDLGVSSMQLDQPDRGFSFRADGPLDMRMDRTGPSAADVVNALDETALASVIRQLGEERRARRVARAICEARRETPINSTGELAAIIRRVVPRARDGIDPATRTFMALRLHVNDELGELERGLRAAEQLLSPGGRLVVVSFHSLEDRLVKRFFRARSGRGAGASRHAPFATEPPAPTFFPLERRPRRPAADEIKRNPRARSARLRAAVRSEHPAWPDPEREAA